MKKAAGEETTAFKGDEVDDVGGVPPLASSSGHATTGSDGGDKDAEETVSSEEEGKICISE